MTRAQREILIERYMEYEMSPQEEGEFIMQAATDADLLRTLHAYRQVHRSLVNSSRAHLGDDDPQEHADAMALLAVHRKPQPIPDSRRLPETAGRVGGIWSSRLLQSVGRPALFALMGFVAGLYSGSNDDPVSTGSSKNRPAAAPTVIAPSQQTGTRPIESPALNQEAGDRSSDQPKEVVPSGGPNSGSTAFGPAVVAAPELQASKRAARSVDSTSAPATPQSSTSATVPRSDIEPITVQPERDTVTFKARGLRPVNKR